MHTELGAWHLLLQNSSAGPAASLMGSISWDSSTNKIAQENDNTKRILLNERRAEADARTVYIGNIGNTIAAKIVREHFSPIGEIRNVHFPRSKSKMNGADADRALNYCFVEYNR
jgi:RNA recognition motif-containing protein